MNIDDWVTGDDTVGGCLAAAFDTCVDVFFWNGAADGFVFDGDPLSCLVGLDGKNDVAVLTAATGLFDEFTFTASWLGDGFAISDLRSAGVGIDLKLAFDAINDDFEVKFTHSGNDGLAGFFVGLDHEGRIFIGEAGEGEGEFLLVGLGSWFDGHRNDWLRESGWFEDDVVSIGGEGVTRGGIFEADHCSDVSGEAGIDVFVFVCLDANQTTNALRFAGAWVVNRVAFANDAGVDAEENEFTDEFVCPEFEGERGEFRVVGGWNFDDVLVVIWVHSFGEWDVERGRKVVDNGVEEVLNAFVFESGAAGNGDELISYCGAADGLLEIGKADFLFHEEFFTEDFIAIGSH